MIKSTKQIIDFLVDGNTYIAEDLVKELWLNHLCSKEKDDAIYGYILNDLDNQTLMDIHSACVELVEWRVQAKDRQEIHEELDQEQDTREFDSLLEVSND